jgi:ubiquinone/menaquinone biosynthesis C-methylase UbiE
MTPEEQAHVIERYGERLRRLGPTVQALGWRDQAQQTLRFDVLTGMVPFLEGKRVLDVGCGFGDFYDHLRSRRLSVEYTGCDISPDMLAVARERQPDLIFEERNILSNPYPDNAFDYVFISGIFNHRIRDNQAFLESMLAAAFRACAHGVAANMMTDQVDYRDAYLYYFNPEQVLGFCRSLSRHVALRHDYPLYEFTVGVYRSPRLDDITSY